MAEEEVVKEDAKPQSESVDEVPKSTEEQTPAAVEEIESTTDLNVIEH